MIKNPNSLELHRKMSIALSALNLFLRGNGLLPREKRCEKLQYISQVQIVKLENTVVS